MKTTWNYSRWLLPFILCMLLSVFSNNAQTLPFRLSKGAGTFCLGVVCGNESCWLDQCSVKKKGQAYTIKDKLWKEGEIKLIVCPLTDSNGFITFEHAMGSVRTAKDNFKIFVQRLAHRRAKYKELSQ